jgi:hypothetical protein
MMYRSLERGVLEVIAADTAKTRADVTHFVGRSLYGTLCNNNNNELKWNTDAEVALDRLV